MLESRGLSNSAAGVADLSAMLGADICFVSCSGPQAVAREADAQQAAVSLVHSRDLACGAVVDGPWQRLAERHGLIQLLAMVGGRLAEAEREVSSQMAFVGEEVRAWCEASADLVLLTDDVAYNRGLYFSSALFARLLLPHYRQVLQVAGEHGAPMGFHSDGDVTLLLPTLLDAGFSFFSLEPEVMDMHEVRRLHGDGFSLISGIRAEWLSASGGVRARDIDLPREISSLCRVRRLILASSCGLYEPSSVALLEKVYRVADSLAEEG